MKAFALISVLSGLLLVGCSPELQVYSDYDRSANMEAYQTFGWLADDLIEARNNPLYYNELNDKRIKTAVAEQLQSRGYTYRADKPQLLIHYHIIVEDKTVMRTDPYGYYYGPYWTRSETMVYEFREGTLIIDLMDAATNNLVWRGWMRPFMKNENPDKAEKSIKEAVMMIFDKYPYRSVNKVEKLDY